MVEEEIYCRHEGEHSQRHLERSRLNMAVERERERTWKPRGQGDTWSEKC